MKLVSITYHEHKDKPYCWSLEDCQLNPLFNLIVGKNATGKSRIVRLIDNFAALLAGNQKTLFASANWEIVLRNSDKEVHYSLFIENSTVVHEMYSVNGETKLHRDASGHGKIWAAELGQEIAFKIGKDEIAAVKKRDEIQHPFLEDLYHWASMSKAYYFSTFNPKTLLVQVKMPSEVEHLQENHSIRNQNKVLTVFQNGVDKFSDDFIQEIKSDMAFIGYDLEDIIIDRYKAIVLPDLQNPICLYLKEKDLAKPVPQIEISQGMFRALSLLIYLAYLKLSEIEASCVLIDDIGEGLDFDRSTKLVKLLIAKIENNELRSQFIATTNDRFVMNKVPLQYWSIIEKLPSKTKIYNKDNSPEIFEEFAFTGLNNFDFFASEFYKSLT